MAIPASAIVYIVTNTTGNSPGGVRFNTDIGAEYSEQTLKDATKFIRNIFQHKTRADGKVIEIITLFIDDIDGVSYTSIDKAEIHVSGRYINKYSEDLKTEIAGILYYEMTRLWQWNGNGHAPSGLIDGIADFVRLKAGYVSSKWVKPGQGDRWDQGYDVTARFLDYCDGLRGGTFVAELNKKMKYGYAEGFFQDLLGKSVDTLWADYKAKYPNN